MGRAREGGGAGALLATALLSRALLTTALLTDGLLTMALPLLWPYSLTLAWHAPQVTLTHRLTHSHTLPTPAHPALLGARSVGQRELPHRRRLPRLLHVGLRARQGRPGLPRDRAAGGARARRGGASRGRGGAGGAAARAAPRAASCAAARAGHGERRVVV